MKNEWTWWDFIYRFECTAICNDLRLYMSRAPVGSGLFFYFKSDFDSRRSDYITWQPGKEDLEHLFERLENCAREFNAVIKHPGDKKGE